MPFRLKGTESERGWEAEGGGGLLGIHVKVLNKNLFPLIEKFRVLTQDDDMRKRKTTEERF